MQRATFFFADDISNFAEPGGAGQEPHGRLAQKQLPREASKAVWAQIRSNYPDPAELRRGRLNLPPHTAVDAPMTYSMDFDPSTKDAQLRVWLMQCAGAKRAGLALKYAKFHALAARRRQRGETTAARSVRVARNTRCATMRRNVLVNVLELFTRGALAFVDCLWCARFTHIWHFRMH